MDLGEIGYGAVDWFGLAQDGEEWEWFFQRNSDLSSSIRLWVVLE
jgi:hypothetical protein